MENSFHTAKSLTKSINYLENTKILKDYQYLQRLQERRHLRTQARTG